MWCKTDGDKEDRRPNGDVGIEGNSGSNGKGEWSEMVWPFETFIKESAATSTENTKFIFYI